MLTNSCDEVDEAGDLLMRVMLVGGERQGSAERGLKRICRRRRDEQVKEHLTARTVEARIMCLLRERVHFGAERRRVSLAREQAVSDRIQDRDRRFAIGAP